jgi:hypothetical protein
MANTFKFGNGQWATKEGSTLAYNDENGNFKPLPFNFTRASSATRVNKDGLIETVGSNEPRVDYKDSTKGALLLEPQRTNLITYSEDFSQGYWTKTGTSVVSGFTSPKGDLSAFKLVANSNNGYIDKQSISISNTTSYASSVYIKRIFGSGNILIRDINGNDIIKTITSEWEKHTLISTSNSTSGNFRITLANSGDEVLIYAAQAEQGSYATSYIPTSGSAVTRVKDSCSQTLPSGIINQDEGTLYVEFNVSTGEGIGGIVEIVNSSSPTNRVLLWDASSGSLINLSAFFGAKSGGITVNNISLGTHKAALTYNSTLTKFFLDGVKIGELQSNASYTGISKIDLENTAGTVNFQQKRIKEVKLYTTALTEQELIALTTL